MRFAQHDVGLRLVVLGAVVSFLLAQTPVALGEHASQPAGYLWLDVNDQPLPFQDHATIREVMRSARIVSREKIGRGVAGAEKLVLEHDGTQFHAVFRSVDVSVRKKSAGSVERPTMRYRDAAIFEVAAYELSELFGIDRVPPVVERRIDMQNGSVQIWMEETRPEDELIKTNTLQPPDVLRWRQQKHIMHVFDSLISNRDRNQGNLLIDRSWNIWFIDHTRAFTPSSELIDRDKLTACERQLWTLLQEIDNDTLRQRLEPYLERQEISKLLRRRIKLIQHIQKLIKKQGEDAVIFDLRPPASENADSRN